MLALTDNVANQRYDLESVKMKFNIIYQIPLWSIFLPIMAFSSAQAANSVASNETQPAVGRMPITDPSKLVFSPVVPKDNETVTLDMAIYSQTDADSDAPAAPLIEWLIDGSTVGTGASYTFSDTRLGGQQLSVKVTPRTLTGEPADGLTVTSSNITVASSLISNFSTPDLQARNWGNADNFCKNMVPIGQWSLPTRSQLQSLYYSATSRVTGTSTTIYEMCDNYSWPMFGHCNGSSSGYWTSELGANSIQHYSVYLTTGGYTSDPSSLLLQVTCVKAP